jgi:hypothetical protein
MEPLADKLTSKKVGSIFIYTNEAHPGEVYPHHTSLEQKIDQAAKFKERWEIKREVLVDTLEGDCHRAFGSMPNMTWILDRQMRPVYKADWTNHESIESAVDDLLSMVERRKKLKLRLSEYNVEKTEYRLVDDSKFRAGLAENGERAVTEWDVQVERWGKRAK